jgi:uncharacterized membrane protein YbhN (UPF0104 family)
MAAHESVSPSTPSNRAFPRWLVPAGLILIVVAVAVWLDRIAFDWKVFWNSLGKLHLGWLAAAALLALSTYFGRAFRWRVLIQPMHPKSNLWNLFTATAIGFTAIVLFGRPGEMVRPYLIACKEKISFSSQMAVWLLERIYDLLMALLIFGIALSRVQASGIHVGPRLQWVLETGGYAVGIVAAICLIVLFLLRQFTEPMRRRLMDALSFIPPKYHARVEAVVTAFTHGVESTRSPWHVLQVGLWSVLEWIIIVGCYICVFRASPVTATFQLMDVLIFVGFVSFGAVVQIPGIGGGMQLVSVVVLTELFGLPVEVSTGMAMVIWAITFVVVVPLGIGLAFHDGIRLGRLRHIDPPVPASGE